MATFIYMNAIPIWHKGGYMNKREKAYLVEVYQDCVSLEKESDLTEYGAGMGDLCIELLKAKRNVFSPVK